VVGLGSEALVGVVGEKVEQQVVVDDYRHRLQLLGRKVRVIGNDLGKRPVKVAAVTPFTDNGLHLRRQMRTERLGRRVEKFASLTRSLACTLDGLAQFGTHP